MSNPIVWAVEIQGERVTVDQDGNQVLEPETLRASTCGLTQQDGGQVVQWKQRLLGVPEISTTLSLESPPTTSVGSVLLDNSYDHDLGGRPYDYLSDESVYTAGRKVLVHWAEFQDDGSHTCDWSLFSPRGMFYAASNPMFSKDRNKVTIPLKRRNLDRPLKRPRFKGLGDAYRFDGTGSATGPVDYDVNPSGRFVISAWVRFQSLDVLDNRIWRKDSATQKFRCIVNETGGGDLSVLLDGAGVPGDKIGAPAGTISGDSQWQLIEFEYDSDGHRFFLRVDGETVAEEVGTGGAFSDNAQFWKFGAKTVGDITDWRYFELEPSGEPKIKEEYFRYRSKTVAGDAIVNEAEETLGAGVATFSEDGVEIIYSGEGDHALAGVEMPILLGLVYNVEGVLEKAADRRYRYHHERITLAEARNRGQELTYGLHFTDHQFEGAIAYDQPIISNTPYVFRADALEGASPLGIPWIPQATLAGIAEIVSLQYGKFEEGDLDLSMIEDLRQTNGFYDRGQTGATVGGVLQSVGASLGVEFFVSAADKLTAFRHEIPSGPADKTWREGCHFELVGDPVVRTPNSAQELLFRRNQTPVSAGDISDNVDPELRAEMVAPWKVVAPEPDLDLEERWADSLVRAHFVETTLQEEEDTEEEASRRQNGLWGAEGLHIVQVHLLSFEAAQVSEGTVLEVFSESLRTPNEGRLYTVVGTSTGGGSYGFGTATLRGIYEGVS